MRAKKGWRP